MWQEKNDQLYKEFIFNDFREAFSFMRSVAAEAERLQHHPKWENEWNKVKIWLSTHDSGGKVTDKDHEMARLIDKHYEKNDAAAPVQPAGQNIYKKIKTFSDGGSRGNPGPSASGYVLMDENENIILKSGVYLGVTTNNQAEYHSLKFALEAAKKIGAQEVQAHMDSLLVINQMKGIFKVKNRDLWPIHQSIKELARHFRKVTYTHVPREFNKLADAEVNETLDAEASKINNI